VQSQLEKVLAGYPLADAEIKEAVVKYIAHLSDKSTPVYEVEEAMSVLRGRIDAELGQTILSLNADYKAALAASASASAILPEYPAVAILEALYTFGQTLPAAQRPAFQAQTSAVWAAVEPYLYSTDVRTVAALLKMMENYLVVEKHFDNMSFTDVVSELRKDNIGDLNKVLNICRAHANLKARNVLLLKVVEEMKNFPLSAPNQRPAVPMGLSIRNEINIRQLKARLGDLAKLHQTAYSQVSFSANLVLMEQYSLLPELRRQRLDEAIVAALSTSDAVGSGDRVAQMKKFVETNIVIRDLLLDALRHDKDYRIAAMEIYLRKIYQKNHHLRNMVSGNSLRDDGSDSSVWIRFEFMTKSVEAVGGGGGDESSSPRVLMLSKSNSSIGDQSLSYSDLAELVRPRSGSEGGSTAPSPSTLYTSYSNTNAGTGGAGSNFSSPTAAFAPGFKTDLFGMRTGIFAVVESFDELPQLFPHIAARIPEGPSEGNKRKDVNAIHIVLMRGLMGGATYDDDCAALLGGFLASQKDGLKSRNVRRVTFLVGAATDKKATSGSIGSVFTFRSKSDFSEDRLFRHIEPPHAFHLDLPRLSNFNLTLETGVQTKSGNVHIYKAAPRSGKGPRRFFARLVSFTSDVHSNDAETLFVEALDSLGLVIGQEEALDKNYRAGSSAANHIFLNIVAPDAVIQPDFYEGELRRICTKYSYKMVRLAISSVELKLTCRLVTDTEPLFIRLIASNPTGFVLKIDQYYEASVGGTVVFQSVSGSKGPLDGLPTDAPYEVSEKFEQQRAQAMASSDTLYAYDWPVLFENAAEKQWDEYMKSKALAGSASPVTSVGKAGLSEPFTCMELVMCNEEDGQPLAKGWTAKHAAESGKLVPMVREKGLNDAGMIAWLVFFRTPEYPQGREVVIICNDITYEAGSFGTKEDVLFFKASQFARQRGIPRLYLAANSGARIGMAQSLKSLFQVCWTDERDPQRGFKYIYLSKDSYGALLEKYKGDVSALPVICTPIEAPEGSGESERYMITDIIGEEPDLGVENLMGSGLIAGETARAYDEIFTLTMVVGRTVGIGAYLVRLGQRTIQRTRNSPIILTGYQALNKLMGREIYTTNDQLGGPMIMFPNGVSHLLAETHMDSVIKALNWLSYVPATRGGYLPVRDMTGIDTVERLVEFAPRKGLTYDPRLLLDGLTTVISPDETTWESGFFDRNSFVEALSGWAKTVVVGRGRLGGIPMGVIITENRTAEATKPADPADVTSQEKMVQQAGGVWFPDSAYKTAQALRDFNREGLPCIIFANWRGFSGGQRDMFDEVLKFGSMIVDALVAYQQPLFVYIPPFAELRGGAWVVVDSTINADVMEFYAAEDARGGVLEAAGAASIKFRDRDIVATAHRLDPALVDLDARIKAAKANGDEATITALEAQVAQREKMLFGVFQQVAVHFADLHDTPGRMKSKGVIRRQVQWAQSRTFFFWRLRRRLTEFDLANTLAKISNGGLMPKPGYRREVAADLQSWFEQQGGSAETWEDDRRMMRWLADNQVAFTNYVDEKKAEIVSAQLAEKLSSCDEATLRAAVQGLSASQRALLASALN